MTETIVGQVFSRTTDSGGNHGIEAIIPYGGGDGYKFYPVISSRGHPGYRIVDPNGFVKYVYLVWGDAYGEDDEEVNHSTVYIYQGFELLPWNDMCESWLDVY